MRPTSIFGIVLLLPLCGLSLFDDQIHVCDGAVTAFLVAAFAGGGGFGAPKATKSKTKVTNKTKKKRSGRGGGLIASSDGYSDNRKHQQQQQEQQQEEGPKLDRFGLPILTAENFFPELSTEIKKSIEAVSSKDEETDMGIIRTSMSGYIPIDFDLFDTNGVEKIISTPATVAAAEGGEGDIEERRQPWKLKLLHKSPPVLAIENFFTDSECEEYIQLTKAPGDAGDDSEQNTNEDGPLKVNSATFSTLAHSKRTSTTWYCHYRQVPALLAKAKHLLNDLPLEQMEEAQVVRYRTGEQFSWHYDEIPREQLSNGGQRVATLLVYLNTLSEDGGGGTIFRDLKGVGGAGGELTMRPKKGSALLFFPAKANGTPDDRSLHKGEVAVEEKTIAQMWIHEGAYNPVVPDGNSHHAAVDLVREKGIQLGYI